MNMGHMSIESWVSTRHAETIIQLNIPEVHIHVRFKQLSFLSDTKTMQMSKSKSTDVSHIPAEAGLASSGNVIFLRNNSSKTKCTQWDYVAQLKQVKGDRQLS